jgi:hypothetical protein
MQDQGLQVRLEGPPVGEGRGCRSQPDTQRLEPHFPQQILGVLRPRVVPRRQVGIGADVGHGIKDRLDIAGPAAVDADEPTPLQYARRLREHRPMVAEPVQGRDRHDDVGGLVG